MVDTFFQQPLFDRITTYKPVKQRNSLNTVPWKMVTLSETQLLHYLTLLAYSSEHQHSFRVHQVFS